MTPNSNSPEFIMHEVPDRACEASKQVSRIFSQLKEDIINNRWYYITKDDISLTYNIYDEITEVVVILRDMNNHLHNFKMQLLPDNGWEKPPIDLFELSYSHDRNSNNNSNSRSFVNYLSDYLSFEDLEITPFLHPYTVKNDVEKYIIQCTEGLTIKCDIDFAYSTFCKLIDITISHLKPLAWFYTKEPNIKNFKSLYYYLAGVKSRLQLECSNGRWDKIDPECFKIEIYEEEKEAALHVLYIVDDVWDIALSVSVAQCDGYFDLFCTFNCYLNDNLSDEIKRQLDTLFVEFLSTLKTAQWNVYVGAREDHSISIQYLYIEDTFDLFCKMLDEIIPALQSFNFQLPLHPIKLTGKLGAIKEQMETAFNTSFEVETEEEQINKKLKMGYFLT